MHDLTAKDILALRDQLEEKAATLLGRILFEFSRLEMELGLCVIWAERGARLEQLTREHEDSSFCVRLNSLRKAVSELLPSDSEGCSAYCVWIQQADSVRQLRNDLVHGRWGVDAVSGLVVNVIGLPTSENQRSVSHSLGQLQQVLENLRSLQTDLRTLRQKWPL